MGPDTTAAFCDGAIDVEPLFYANQVDLALWGHVHNTLVTCPVFNGTCQTPGADGFAGTVHAVIGNGGQDLSGIPPVAPPWQVYMGNEFGWSYFDANATHLAMFLLDDATNATSFAFTLTRPAAAMF